MTILMGVKMLKKVFYQKILGRIPNEGNSVLFGAKPALLLEDGEANSKRPGNSLAVRVFPSLDLTQVDSENILRGEGRVSGALGGEGPAENRPGVKTSVD